MPKPKSEVTLLVDIRALRREENVGVKKAAEWMRVPPPRLDRIEDGATPSLGNALKIAAFMRMPVEQIWKVS